MITRAGLISCNNYNCFLYLFPRHITLQLSSPWAAIRAKCTSIVNHSGSCTGEFCININLTLPKQHVTASCVLFPLSWCESLYVMKLSWYTACTQQPKLKLCLKLIFLWVSLCLLICSWNIEHACCCCCFMFGPNPTRAICFPQLEARAE